MRCAAVQSDADSRAEAGCQEALMPRRVMRTAGQRPAVRRR